ncbi:hypothetical protein EVAR_93111_1 [Eumeta japonica]|uniref:Uncharacterized protein n=1 Tax=Eumeta variegata TaxID=151549 RepID=A0A4C1TID1_EUMVA|nr:hypothetical protein EVAR_93111_1 [Eumeta japonica]
MVKVAIDNFFRNASGSSSSFKTRTVEMTCVPVHAARGRRGRQMRRPGAGGQVARAALAGPGSLSDTLGAVEFRVYAVRRYRFRNRLTTFGRSRGPPFGASFRTTSAKLTVGTQNRDQGRERNRDRKLYQNRDLHYGRDRNRDGHQDRNRGGERHRDSVHAGGS